MQKYYVFFLNSEVCYSYFYKPELLNRFFQSFFNQQNRMDLAAQFHYITRVISADQLLHYVSENAKKNRYVQNQRVVYYFNQNATNTFTVHDRWLEVDCESLEVANTMLFECLEKYDHCCFIMEESGLNYGWLSPIKKQVLLS